MKIFTRMNGKKASLELSINAIVILVMAMVVLGLGLGFIRGLFNQGTDNLGKVLDNSVLENPANSETPVTVDRNTKIKSGGTAKVRIGYYNDDSVGFTATPAPDISGTGIILCLSSEGLSTQFTLTSPSVSVDAGQAVAFEAILLAPDTADKGTYVCPLVMTVTGGYGPGTSFYVDVTG